MTVFCTSLAAQNSQRQEIDSLRKVISQFEGKEKLDKYRRLIGEYSNKNMDTVLFQLIDNWETEANEQRDIDHQCLAKYRKTVTLYNKNMPDRIISLAPAYLELFRNNDKDNEILYYRIYYFLIHSFLIRGEPEVAVVQAQEMYQQAETKNNNVGKGLALHAMTLVYSAQDRADKGEETIRKAIDLFESAEETIESNDKLDLYSMLETAYSYLCLLLLEQHAETTPAMISQYEAFLSRFDAVYKHKTPRVNLWNMYVLYYIQTKEYDKAEKYCDTIENVLATGYSYLDAVVYRLKIYAGKGEYEKALEQADKALTLADSFDVSWLGEIYSHKMESLAKTGQAGKLLELATNVITRKDSLYRKDIAYQIDELRTKYDLDRHIIEKENMRREKENMRRYFYIAIVACIVILLMWIYHSRVVNRKNRGLIRKINEQDTLFAERERQYEHNLNAAISTKNNGKNDDNNNNDTLFIRLNRLVKKRLLAKESISRISIALELGINDRALYDCAKSNTGLNFNDYITYMRLAYARELLANTDNQFTMDKIALDAGFGSRATFFRLFKEHYDLTPDEFRKLVHKTPKNENIPENEEFIHE
jgi:AraC-like DNA-binding protein/flagellin-specific chaperone FliS